MIRFLAARLVLLAVTLMVAAFVIFFAVELLPGDAAQILLGTEVRPDTLAALRAQLGLDRPAAERFLTWIAGLLTGDLGESAIYRVPIAEMLAQRLAVSIPLALMAFILAIAMAVPFGVAAASRPGGLADLALIGFAQIGLAIPNFWFAILLILVFSIHFSLLPAGGFPGWEAGFIEAFMALLLPAFALALSEAAILSRVVRTATLETLKEDYMRTARAKGLSRAEVMVGHALGNAMIPIMTVLGLQLAILIAGAVIIENVFYLPGVGRLLLQAVFDRDLALVRDLVLLFGAFVIVLSFLVDMLYGVIDPRLRHKAADI